MDGTLFENLISTDAKFILRVTCPLVFEKKVQLFSLKTFTFCGAQVFLTVDRHVSICSVIFQYAQVCLAVHVQ